MKLSDRIRELRRKFDCIKYKKANVNVILILTPYSNVINGGHLSFSSLYNIFKKKKHIHNSYVIMSYLFLENRPNYIRFRKFKSNAFIQDLKSIFNHFNSFNHLTIHIPDMFVPYLVDEMKSPDYPKYIIEKIKGAKQLTFNILNQNDELMETVDKKYIDWLKVYFGANITMTMAHRKYTTIEKQQQYGGIPIHHLSAWLNCGRYIPKSFEEKENIILLSPDDLKENEELSKQEFIEYLSKHLPDFKIVVVQDIKYEEYRKLNQRAKFTITFGEGLDGYFVETAFYGGVPFAIYNNIFFTENYKHLKTIYNSFSDLYENIVKDIKKINNSKTFHEINKEIVDEIEKEYSYELYDERVTKYFKNEFDLP